MPIYSVQILAKPTCPARVSPKADLRNTDLHGTKWQDIAEIKLANVFGVKNTPAGFLEWAEFLL
jgi:hypothetical protein